MKRRSSTKIDVPISGIQKLSLVDYPGHTAAALFTLGCNMRCGYCHNPELVLPDRYLPTIPVDGILRWLKLRQGKLDGVAISGGEPTIHQGLPELCRSIKSLGFLIKLDSNGTNPDMLSQLIDEGLVDFVAMDIKGPLERYSEIAARPIDTAAINRSVRLLIDSGIEHEFRTTIVKNQLAIKEFGQIGELVRGAKRYALQRFRPGKTLSPRFRRETSYSDAEMLEIKQIMEKYVDLCVIH